MLGILIGVDEGNVKGLEIIVLCIILFEIVEMMDELFVGNVFVVCKEIVLGGLLGVVDEDVGVSGYVGDGVNYVVINKS